MRADHGWHGSSSTVVAMIPAGWSLKEGHTLGIWFSVGGVKLTSPAPPAGTTAAWHSFPASCASRCRSITVTGSSWRWETYRYCFASRPNCRVPGGTPYKSLRRMGGTSTRPNRLGQAINRNSGSDIDGQTRIALRPVLSAGRRRQVNSDGGQDLGRTRSWPVNRHICKYPVGRREMPKATTSASLSCFPTQLPRKPPTCQTTTRSG